MIFLNHHYSIKKKRSRKVLADIEEATGKLHGHSSQNKNDLEQEEAKADISNRADRGSKIFKFINTNLMRGAERRLTVPNGAERKRRRGDATDLFSMSRDNLRRLKRAYRHPFERIPEMFFNGLGKKAAAKQEPSSKM